MPVLRGDPVAVPNDDLLYDVDLSSPETATAVLAMIQKCKPWLTDGRWPRHCLMPSGAA